MSYCISSNIIHLCHQKLNNRLFIKALLQSRQLNFNREKNYSSKPIYKNYRVTGSGIGSHCNIITQDDWWNIASDVPISQGGTNKAPQPVLLLLASLCGCELATARYVGFKSDPKIVMGRIEFDVNAKRDERGALHLPINTDPPVPARLEHVWGTATVYDTNASQKQISMLGHEVHRRCPVANMMVLSGCRLEIAWKIANS